MRETQRLLSRVLASFVLIISSTFLLNSPVSASTPNSPSYDFGFEGNYTASTGAATIAPTSGCAGWSCSTSETFGSQSGDGYWQWSGASGSGPGMALNNYSISDTYTVLMKFSVSSLTRYTRILNFNEGDTGLYLLNGLLYYYMVQQASAPTYAPDDVITFALTRTPQYVTIYTSDSNSSATTQQIRFAASTYARPNQVGGTFLLFTDDGGEFAASGKLFRLAIWNDRALSSTEINSFLFNPLVPWFAFANGSNIATYGIPSAIDVEMNLPGKVTFLQGEKKIAGCINISTSGSADSYTSRCNWKPTIHKGSYIKAIFTPTDTSYPRMSITKYLSVLARSNKR
jgi:hypothetical protein